MFKRKFPLEFFFHSCEYLLGLNRIISYYDKILGTLNNHPKRHKQSKQKRIETFPIADETMKLGWSNILGSLGDCNVLQLYQQDSSEQ